MVKDRFSQSILAALIFILLALFHRTNSVIAGINETTIQAHTTILMWDLDIIFRYRGYVSDTRRSLSALIASSKNNDVIPVTSAKATQIWQTISPKSHLLEMWKCDIMGRKNNPWSDQRLIGTGWSCCLVSLADFGPSRQRRWFQDWRESSGLWGVVEGKRMLHWFQFERHRRRRQ